MSLPVALGVGSGAVRPLVAADLAAFRALRLEALKTAPTAFLASVAEEQSLSDEAALRRLVGAPPAVVFGAFVGGRLVGTAGFDPNRREKQSHRGTLWGVYVDPGQRGKGLARAVVEAVINHARAHVRVLDAVVVATNSDARALYRRLGFAEYGVVTRSIHVGGVDYDDVLLALDLDR